MDALEMNLGTENEKSASPDYQKIVLCINNFKNLVKLREDATKYVFWKKVVRFTNRTHFSVDIKLNYYFNIKTNRAGIFLKPFNKQELCTQASKSLLNIDSSNVDSYSMPPPQPNYNLDAFVNITNCTTLLSKNSDGYVKEVHLKFKTNALIEKAISSALHSHTIEEDRAHIVIFIKVTPDISGEDKQTYCAVTPIYFNVKELCYKLKVLPENYGVKHCNKKIDKTYTTILGFNQYYLVKLDEKTTHTTAENPSVKLDEKTTHTTTENPSDDILLEEIPHFYERHGSKRPVSSYDPVTSKNDHENHSGEKYVKRC
jgi:hypothetical protein